MEEQDIHSRIRNLLAEAGNTQPAPAAIDDASPAGALGIERILQIGRNEGREQTGIEKQKLAFASSAAISIVIFGLLLASLVAWLGTKRIIQPSKLIALTLIVTAALLLIVLGYTDEQMSPVIGLLGTVAGYMLGSKEWDHDRPTPATDPPAAD